MSKRFLLCFIVAFMQLHAAEVADSNVPLAKIGDMFNFTLTSDYVANEDPPQESMPVMREPQGSRYGRALSATPCSPGNYDNSGTCSPCGTMCTYCDDNGGCLGCQNNYTMKISSNKKDCECKDATNTEGACTCSQAKPWFDGSTCQTCESGSYYGRSGCTACSTSRSIRVKSIIKAKKSPSCCPDGKYLDSSNSKCSGCDANCELCEDGTAGRCDKCTNKLRLVSQVKIKKTSCCGDGKFRSSDVSSCTDCPGNCKQCADSGSGEICLQCAKTFRVRSILKIKKTSCCGDGQFRSSDVSPCKDCPDKNCKNCEDSGSGNTCIQCSKILTVTDTLQVKKTSCCQEGQFVSSEQPSCRDCFDLNCKYCEDSGSGNNCFQCKKTLSFKNTLRIKKTSCCGEGYYVSSDQTTCAPCDSANCKYCEDSGKGETCIQCSNLLTLTPTLRVKKTTCCLDGYFISSTTTECTKCPDDKCKLCEDSESGSSCLQCHKTLSISDTLNVKKTTCCEEGKFVSSSHLQCKDCADSNCKYCEDSGDGTVCKQCKKKLSFTDTLEIKKTSCCQEGKFVSSTHTTCTTCDSLNCKYCEDSGDGEICLQCYNLLNFSSTLKIKKTTCCPDGQYVSSIQSTCKPCDDHNCSICEDSGSGTTCLKCSGILTISDTLKIKKTTCCEDGKFVSDAHSTCTNCFDSNCNICEDSGDGEACLDCAKKFKFTDILDIKKTTCCSLTTYRNGDNCDPCPSKCDACEDVTGECITCSDKIKFTGTLVNPSSCCADGTYYSAGSCVACDETCATCDKDTGKCLTCLDKMKRDSGSNDMKCKCIGDQIQAGKVCSCPTGEFFNGQVCSVCGHFCNTCTLDSVTCETCIDQSRMMLNPDKPAECKCKGDNQQEKANGSGCICKTPDTYFNNGDCTSCGDNCLICDDTGGCASCTKKVLFQDTLIDPASCCSTGTFYDKTTSACISCKDNCATCDVHTGVCTTCKDDSTMEKNPEDLKACRCKSPMTWDGTVCKCPDAGQKWSGTDCITCGHFCYTCNADGTVCSACTDLSRMMLNPDKPAECKCKGDNQQENGNGCICKTQDTYFNNGDCTSCGVNCLICDDTGGCTSCVKNVALEWSLIDPALCCASGTYYDSVNSVCISCEENCATCDAHTGVCDTCKKTKMEVDPTNTKTCHCIGDQVLVGGECICAQGSFNGQICSPCGTFCKTCDETGKCESCIDSDRMILSTTDNKVCECKGINLTPNDSGCSCAAGKYFSNGDCVSCDSTCPDCDANTGNCKTCVDPSPRMAVSQSDSKKCQCLGSQQLVSNQCSCTSGSYYTGSTCEACGDNCQICADLSGQCSSCKSSRMTFDSNDSKKCVCKTGQHLVGSDCVCDEGTYYDTNNKVCIPCEARCATCADDGTCITCKEGRKMDLDANLPKTCKCKSDQTTGLDCSCATGSYFDTSISNCKSCETNCLACLDFTGDCTSCKKNIELEWDLIDPATCCGAGTYYSDGSCVSCSDKCAECDIHTGKCTKCKEESKMIFDDTDEKNCKCAGDQQYVSGQCTCPAGKEFNGLVCSICGTFCKGCASDTLVCTECIDSSRMQFGASDNKICECKGSSQTKTVTGCECAIGKYFTNNDCAPCGSLCATCADTTGICSSCKDATMTKSDDNLSCKCKPGLQLDAQAGTCKCSSGYYFDGNTCQPCGTHCSVCDSTRCSVCDSISHLIVDPSNSSNCICENSYYWIVANNDCEQCPEGTYYDRSKCSSCSTNCKACDNFTGKCNTCVGGDRMEYDPLDNTACRCKGTQTLSGLTCTCGQGKYFINGDCAECLDLCKSCKDNTGECTMCNDHTQATMTFDTNDNRKCKCRGDQVAVSGQCTCPAGQEFNGSMCSVCGHFCKVCTAETLVCTECIDSSRMQFGSSDNKICECKGSSQTTTANGCICDAGKYFKNNDCVSCGSLCAACADTTGICSSCFEDTMTKSDDNLSCKCKPGLQYDAEAYTCFCTSGYFDGNTCQLCGTHCSDCDSNGCSMCKAIDHLIVDPSNRKNCICESGYYWIVANNDCEQCPEGTYYDGSKCSSCSTNCKACDNFTGKCNTCVGGDRMEFHPTDDKACRCKGTQILSGLTCSCSSGSYFDNLTCSPCSDLCSVCTDLTGECTKCKDLSLMTIDPQNNKNCKCKHSDLTVVSGQCVCTGGKQWNGSECTLCGNFCKTCDLGNNVCTACIDSKRMDPVSSSVTCKCKAGFITSTTGCTCAASSYYDNSSCFTCGDLCTSCADISGDCTACKDSTMEFHPTNKKICRCKGTQQYSTVLNTCSCPIGYFDGSTCQSCTTLCLTCDSAKCLTCQNIPHLVVDNQNSKDCVCASGYNWITAAGSCEQCSVGTYYDGNKCASCSAMCATCSGLTGTCDTCKDPARMDLSGATCICKGNQKLAGSTCFCDAGYYFDGDTCVKCSNLCSACNDYTGVCTTCKDSKMTFDSNDNKNCKCIGDQILSGETCTCPSNQQFNGDGCSACGEFCSTCDVNAKICSICIDGNKMSPVSGTVTCACKGNQIKANTGCTCPSGSYFDSTTCSTCGDFCTTCTDLSGACTVCKNDKMEVSPSNPKVCRCKGTQQYNPLTSSCYCPTGYYDGSTCQSCTTLCSTCESTKCLTCQGIANLIVDPQNPTNCVCASGYNWITAEGTCQQCSVGTYYDGNKCASCAATCATCSGLTGTCNTCKDTVRMDLSGATCICKGTQKLTESACSCDAGYYFDGSTCVQCSSLCASCSDYTGECKSCKDSKMTFDPANKKSCICIGDQTLDNGVCTCPIGQQFNGVKCSECGTFCNSCNVSGKICNICVDSAKMLATAGTTTCSCKGDQTATVSGCSCPTGFYFKDSKCTQCGSLCALCADTTGICSTCKNDSTMEVNPDDTTTCRCKGTQQYSNALSACTCPVGYFDNGTCKSCTTLCSTCDSTKCLTCQSIAHLVVDTQNPKNCVCAGGYNWITAKSICEQCSAETYYDGNKCASCGTNCATCYDGTGICKTCKSSRMEKGGDPTKCICKGTQKISGSTCSCDAGYYFDGDTCVQCSDLCNTCEDYTGVCKTCKDSKLMTFDSNDNKKCKCIGDQTLSGDTCTCLNNQQFNGYVCSTCGEFCNTCDVNAKVCSTCIDGNKMSPVSGTVTCACKGNQIKTNTGCTCPSGSYFDSTTCSTCGDFCTTCTDTSGACTVCKNDKMEVNPSNPKVCRCKGTQQYNPLTSSCYCPTGYYDGSTCQSCTTLCSTCDSTKCLTCQGIANLIVDPQNPTNCVCASGYNWITAEGTCQQCSVGTYYDGNKCASCAANCASCYNGSGTCNTCKDPAKMDLSGITCICKGTQKLTGSTCSCDAGYYFDGSTCVQCSNLCSSCSDYTGECKSCNDSKMTIDPANKKNCICIGDQVLNNNMCTCPASKQFNGSGCSDCGTFCSTCIVSSNTCNTCIDGNKMSPVSSTVTCACKGNQISTNAGCSCPSGSYFDSSTCSTCGDLCTTCTDTSGVCTACKDSKMEVDPSNQKVCRCKGTQKYSYALSSCYCPTGYYDGSTCQSCTTLCSTCDSTKCLTCQSIANLIVDPQNPTNCVCASGYNWITAKSTCEPCLVGSYYDGNKCATCSDNCASCYDRTGFCKVCNSRFTPSTVDPTKCICKGTQKIAGSTCSCDAGYYFDGDTCVQCSDLCSTCEDYTGVCKTCKDSKLMTFDSNDNKKCKCIGDQILSGDTCTCPSNQQFNGDECSVCGVFCSTCDVNGQVCSTCLDGDKMSPVSGTVTCACKGNQIPANTGCTCPSGSYFDSSTCSTCGDFCTTCTDTSGVCTACKDSKMEVDPANTKACRCKGTQKYSYTLSSCYCPTGYFDGSTCQSCTALCSICDSAKCLTCQSIANLVVDTQNPKNCVCAVGYNWITASSSCNQCSVGTYYDGNKCADCSDNCASCYNGSGFCAVCKDSRMMISTSDPTKCICKGNQKLTGSVCSCDSGYYFDGSNCVQCSSLCTSCSDYTGECLSCKDSTMTIDPANKKNCICIGDQILDGNNACTCLGTQQFNGAICSDCGTFCTTCNVNQNVCSVCLGNRMEPVSNTVTCACKGNQLVSASDCSCKSGFYFDSTTCLACGTFCTTCEDLTGKCNTCSSATMEVSDSDPKTCKCKGNQVYSSVLSSCYCPTGYFDGSTCQSCTTLCSTCDSAKCLTCQSIANLIVDPQNLTKCVCAAGYNWITATSSCEVCETGTYFDGNKCASCTTNCASCYYGTGFCALCKDVRMTINTNDLTSCICKGNQKISGSTCYCDSGYYFDGSNCVQCSSLCTSCSDYTGECLSCKGSKMTIDPANKKNCICIGDQILDGNNACTCSGTKQFNGKECVDCGYFCSTCDVSGNTCNTCIDSVRMEQVSNTLTCQCKGNQTKNIGSCTCPSGNYFDNSNCEACGDLCAACDDSTGKCNTCINTATMEISSTDSKTCKCKGTQQYSSLTKSCSCTLGYFDGSTCQSCTTLCSSCNAIKCLACLSITNLEVDPTNPTTCHCAAGYNWITATSTCEQCQTGTYYDGDKCAPCSTNCAKCYNGSGICSVCVDTRMDISLNDLTSCACRGNQKISGSTCSCDSGYYFDGSNCVKCSDLCATCLDYTGICTACKDSAKMTFDTANKKNCKCIGDQVLSNNVCTCTGNKQFNGSGCSDCGTFCSACNVNTKICNTCIDTVKMTAVSGTVTCTCKSGQQVTATGCICASGSYFDTTTCSACGNLCATCAETTGQCLTCKNSVTMEFGTDPKTCKCKGTQQYNSETALCYCASGYFDGSTCQSCSALCSTCDSSKCLTCQNIANLEVDLTNPKTCHCAASYKWIVATSTCEQCATGTYYDGSQCTSCSTNCASCFDGLGICGKCTDSRMTPNLLDLTKCICKGNQIASGSTCTCDSGFYFNGENCVQCSSLCSSCLDYSGQCTSCKNSQTMIFDPDSNKACKCIGDQYLSNGVCACDAGKQFNGEICSTCGKFCKTCNVAANSCSACINDSTMTTVASTLTCSCRPRLNTIATGCTCNSNFYFDGSTCSACGGLCDTCTDISGKCNACKNMANMEFTADQKNCRCKGTQLYSVSKALCYCASGYFDGSTCQRCSALCSTCNSATCLTCQAIDNLVVDSTNPKTCKCASGYKWIVEGNTSICGKCLAGTYYDGTKCSSCSTNCATCYEGAGLCETCSDSLRMQKNPSDLSKCICKGNQKVTGSTCTCDAGYYFDGDNCVQCSDLCKTCKDYTGECQGCIDSSKMIIDTANKKNCKCIGDQTLSNKQCICSGTKQFNGSVCSDCGYFCSTCNTGTKTCLTCVDSRRMSPVSGTTTCACKSGQITNLNSCSCTSGSYFDDTTCPSCQNKCVSCKSLCATCDDYTGNCQTCKDTERMDPDPADKTNCKCRGTQQLVIATSSCICAAGTYYNGATCLKCGDRCATCEDYTGNCKTCLDPSRMDLSDKICQCKGSQQSNPDACSCLSMEYFDGSTCQSCGKNCKTCKDTTAECTTCYSNYALEQIALPLVCSCPAKTYDVISGCNPCGTMCASCLNAGVCSTCNDNTAQELDQNNNQNCKCKAANYYDGTTCKSCGTYCAACEATKCTQCVDTDNMIYNAINARNCECKLGMYYDANSGKCVSCMDKCNVCSSGTSCTTCESGYYFDVPTSSCKVTTCDSGTYYDENSCKACTAPCLDCSSSTFCYTCITADFSIDARAGTCNCVAGKYYRSSSKTCELCGQYCSTCTGAADFCSTCIDSTMTYNAVTGVCTCPAKTYFSEGVCKSCADPCSNCSSLTFCLSCVDATMTLTATTGVCRCKDGTYFDSTSHKCLACDATCATCSSSSSCSTCKDPTMSISAGVCTCPARQYFDTQSLSCKNCDATCGKCTSSSSSSCTACRDAAMALTNGVCTCPSTQYFNLVTNACKTCTGPCKSCTSDTFCTSCLDTATLNSQTGVCSCADKQYFNSTHSKCTTCNGLCNTCSSYSTCITCVDKTNPVSNGVCTCANGYYALDKQCVMCPSPCSTCSSATVCTGCKKHATLNNSSKKCTCDRGYGLNSTDTSGYCVATCNKLCTVCDIDNANLCSSCVTNAELTGTACACTANSAYSSAAGGCACNAGYTLSNSKCVVCKRYLAPSDLLSAEFSSSWTSISINFNTKVDTSVDPSCSKTFTAATVALFGTGAVCSWTDKKTLKIALGTGFSLRYSTLYLDGTYILKDSSDPCTTNYQPLSLIPTSTSSPVPTAIITGQSSFTLGCGSDPLTFSGDKSTGSLGNNLSYLWAVTSISPANSKVSDAINNKADSSISIDRSYFDSTTTTTVTVSLTVTNFMTISSTASFTTTVTGGNALTVIFDQGNTVSMKSSTSKTLKAKVTSLCGTTTGTITWAWSYDSGPTIDSASILANANADKLTINANALAASSTPYVFKATASQVSNGSTITGSATISVTVTASALSVGLSKTSGDVSPDRDYTINAQNSKDPDSPSSTYEDFTYKWTCLNSLDNSACVGADGKTPLSSDTDSTLTIPSSQMVKGAQWEITCTISKDTRTAAATISLNILSKTSDVSIEIEYKVQKYNPNSNIVITAQVTAATSATLKWAESSGSISISPGYLSTMSVLPSQLTAGSTYTFTLTITLNDVSINAEYPITLNLGAACTGEVKLNPETGTAITTSFKLSIEGCYDKDEEDYPLSYTYLDYSNNKAYTLGYTTEINSLSTYLFPQKNTITIRVCDHLKTCNDYKKDVTIGNFNSRRLETSSLMDAYKESTVDVDNVPSTISLFCSSATIDSELFSLMWTDLQNYISSNEVTNDVLENALGATYSMTGQTEQMSVDMFQTFALWLSKIIVDNPDLVPSQDNMNTIVALADNYLAYGNMTEFSTLSLEGYIMNIDAFLAYWEIAATKDDLVTQGAMDGSQNTDMTKIYKYRDFPTSMANRTVPFSNNRTISMPAKFSYSDNDVMNIKLHYFNTSNDYSDLVMLSFAHSGTYENLKLETTNETYMPFSTTDYPVILEMPISQNITEGYDWTCLFYNETSKAWLHDGCTVTEIKNDSVVFEVYHFSMFKLGQAEPQAPPNPYPQPSGPSCGDNYAPLYILVVVLFISMILAPIMIIYDRLEKVGKTVEATPHPTHVPRPTERALMSPSTDSVETAPRSARHFFQGTQPRESIELADGEEIVEESEQRSSDDDSNDIVDSVSIDLTENSYAQPIATETEVEKPEDESKTELAELIEGHLIFGLVYFRSNFSRWARLFTLATIIIFELLLEGLLLFGFENTDSGSSASTETLFNDYEAKYFGYTILALAIAIPIEIFMVIALSIDRTKAPAWTAAAVALGITIIIGSIIGIVMLSFSFCFEWSGYWAICFLYGILIQIFIFETFYMIVRYFILQMVAQVEETKTKA